MSNEIKFNAKDGLKRCLSIGLAVMLVLGTLLPQVTESAHAFTGKKGSKYTVTDGGRITYGSGEGGYSNSRKCDLGDDLGNRYSYCVQPSKASPGTGTVTVDKVVTDDNDTGKWNALRNVIYYSPSYPGYDNNVKNIRGTYYTGNASKDWGIAHLALSYVYAGRPSDMDTWGGTHASDLGDVWTKAKALGNALWADGTTKDDAVPDSFKVFICYMSGVQDMIVGYLEAPGKLKMTKSSAIPSITDGNASYSLEAAEFTVYDSAGKKAGVLKTDSKGVSNTIELPEGKYTVKETKAPKGYEFVTGEITEIEVSGKWAEVLIEMDRKEQNNDRAETRRHESADFNMNSDWLIDEGADTWEILSTETMKEAFRKKAAEILTEKQMDAVEKICIERYTEKEYARIVGISQPVAHKRVSAAKRKIKKFWK